jgi:thiamine transporter
VKIQSSPTGESTGKSVALNPRKETERIRIITETIVMVALSGALYLIKIFTLPQGGSITLGSMVPIFLLALRRGPRIGIVGGVAFGLVALVEDVYSGVEVIFYPAQVILDYPLAFGLLGLAGFFRKVPVLGVGVGITARFCSHFISGVLFFASYAPAGVSPFVYSAVYNGGFLIPEFVITAALMIVLVRVKALELYR